jgi:hypothetical protein
MRSFFLGNKMVVVLLLVALAAGAAWWQRGPLLARYYVRQLCQAEAADREEWVSRVVAQDAAALPPLLERLTDADKGACENAGAALLALADNWGADDARSLTLVEQLAADFAGYTVPGKTCALQVSITLLKKSQPGKAPPALTTAGDAMLALAEKTTELRAARLFLAGALLERQPAPARLEQCRQLSREGLAARDAEQRLAAVQLAMRGPLRQDKALLASVVPLLKDRSAPVRKAALGALGPARDVIGEDDLLPLLHDPDDDVQHLCEMALRSRGLQESHILLARLISDDRPAARLQVLQHLGRASDLEPGVWLRRLCQDPTPSVRAAAIRAAVSQTQVDLRPCLRELAQQDPSPTVRQLAGHYLSRPLATRDD